MLHGWIKLYRALLDSNVFRSEKTLKVWIWCLLRASHKETKFTWNHEEIKLLPGQFTSGRITGSSECNMEQSTFWKQIKKLEKLNQISLKCNNRFTLFTVVNWYDYQIDEEKGTTKEQQSDNKVTTKEHIQECNNDKNERKKIVPEKLRYGENVLLSAEEYEKLLAKFGSEARLKQAIDILDHYIGSSGRKYKSHYHTILGWVTSELEKRERQHAATRTNTTAGQSEQMRRATFKHSPADAERIRNLKASLELITGERTERAGSDSIAPGECG